MTVAVQNLLHQQDNVHVIAPVLTVDGRLYTHCGEYTVVLYPFVAGRGVAPVGEGRAAGCPCTVDPDAPAYYRCERIVQDIAVYCRELLGSAAGGADRPEQLRQLAGQFEPGGVVEIALATS